MRHLRDSTSTVEESCALQEIRPQQSDSVRAPLLFGALGRSTCFVMVGVDEAQPIAHDQSSQHSSSEPYSFACKRIRLSKGASIRDVARTEQLSCTCAEPGFQ